MMTRFGGLYNHLCSYFGIVPLLILLVTPDNTVLALQVRRPAVQRSPHSLTPNRVVNNRPTSGLYAQPQEGGQDVADSQSRRSFLTTALGTPLLLTASPQPAHAGLIQFPCKTLKNRYHFMRAGPSELEADGIYSTNPLFLTNRENGLLTNRVGTQAVLDACAKIKASPNFPTVAYHSLAANGMDTADMVATELRISRDRLLPEFTYLDQRGIGLWDSGSVDDVKPAIVALDYMEGGRMGSGGRPPPNEDGTPNETLGDQFVRLRQFLSLQESRTSGENILIIFPDGTGPALLSAMIAGIPLNEAHCLDYKPGEVRLDISRESILELYEQRKEDPDYLAMIEDGKEKLTTLRNLEKGDVVNLKDELREQERLRMEKEFALKKQQEREEEARKREELRQLQLQREAEARERAKQIQKEKAEAAAAKKAEQDARNAAKREAAKAAASSMPSTNDNKGMDAGALLGVLGVGVLGAGAAVLLGGGGDDNEAAASTTTTTPTSPSTNNVVIGANGTATVGLSAAASATLEEDNVTIDLPLPKPSSSSRVRPASATPELLLDDDDKPSAEDSKAVAEIEEELKALEAAQDALFATIDNNMPPPTTLSAPTNGASAAAGGDDMPLLENEGETVDEEMDRLETAQEAMNDYFEMDDGGDAWLQVMAQIVDEPDEEVDRVNGEGRY